MDPQQELFSALLIALKEKYKNTGIDCNNQRLQI